MQNRFWRRSVRRRRPGGGENQKISNINPFHLTDSTLKTLFMIKKYNNIKYESVVQQRSPLHRPRGGLRRKMADFIIVIISLVWFCSKLIWWVLKTNPRCKIGFGDGLSAAGGLAAAKTRKLAILALFLEEIWL